jgi:polysaccharide pyruvyl transferase WcaK-like protein
MRIGLVTTLQTNIGDDLIRDGICALLRRAVATQELAFVPVNKHRPATVFPAGHPLRLAHAARLLNLRKMGRLTKRYSVLSQCSLFDRCDMVVQCGTPVLWPGCSRSEWADLLWLGVLNRLHQRIRILNLAAGSCYPWERKPDLVDNQDDQAFLKAILRLSHLTTARDRLAVHLLSHLGYQVPRLPCTAFLAADGRDVPRGPGEVVLINYMAGGGHYDWDQHIDATRWRDTVRSLVNRLGRRHRLAFLCHDAKECQLARDMAGEVPCLWPRSTGEYLGLVAGAKAALCNRMHAAVALASLGIPSVAVCTDTRLLMVEALGLPCIYVKQAEAGPLEALIEDLIARRPQERERLAALQDSTRQRYLELIGGAIG